MTKSVEMVKQMSEEDIQKILKSMNPEQMDKALDIFNTFKKIKDNDDGTSDWSKK